MAAIVNLTVDGRQIRAAENEILLWVALDNDIYIPHLCAYREDGHPIASCRLCFVEVEGHPTPVPACTLPASEGLIVKTRSPQVDDLVAAGFELIMSNHRLDCKNCSSNGHCELQHIAKNRNLSLKPKNLPELDKHLPVDDSATAIVYDPNKCVLCGQCIRACRHSGKCTLGFAQRGYLRMVTTFNNMPLGESNCTNCGACVKVCPAGALAQKQ